MFAATRASELLSLDVEQATAEITRAIRVQVLETLRRKGVVVGLSGGVDSAVVAALAALALGPRAGARRCLMPDRDSSADSLRLGRELSARARHRDGRSRTSPPALEGIGCYRRQLRGDPRGVPRLRRRLQACKISLPPLTDGERFNVFRLTVRVALRGRALGAYASGRLSAARGRHQLQAARPHGDGILTTRIACATPSRGRRTGSKTIRGSS
jgi:hypothetical protein